MPLINLQTNLKSLKYGHDRQGGGDSGLPYIQTNINDANPGIKFDDGFVRGGAVNAARLGIIDTKRIFKFLKDVPQGPLFIARQAGLQLANPRLEVPKNPSNIIIGAPANLLAVSTNGLLQPTRIYNLGLNTIAQIPVNAFGGHFVRHGILPIQNEASKYEAVVAANNAFILNNSNVINSGYKSVGNRLLRLATKFDLGKQETSNVNTALNRARGFINRLATTVGINIRGLKPDDLVIDEYKGGPGSIYGIVGSTTINRTLQVTNDKSKIEGSLSFSNQLAGRTRDNSGAPNSVNYFNDLGKGPKAIDNYDFNFGDTSLVAGVDQNAVKYSLPVAGNPSFKTYAAIKSQTKTKISQEIPNTGNYNPAPPQYSSGSISTVQDNLVVDRNAVDYKYYGRAVTSDSGSVRKYNNTEVFNRNDASIFTVIFRAINPFGPTTIDRSTGLPGNEERWAFNGYLNGYKDGFNATWNDINYVGRAESFYVYNKFKRSVSFGLQVPCFNKTQLFEKHRALGQLASVTAGSYNNKLLGGVLLKVNVGNYLVGEYATLDSLDYSIPAEASWDIADDALLSMYLDVSFNLTIIHKELPQYEQKGGGFFKHLPDIKQSESRQGGFITPAGVVKKFTKD